MDRNYSTRGLQVTTNQIGIQEELLFWFEYITLWGTSCLPEIFTRRGSQHVRPSCWLCCFKNFSHYGRSKGTTSTPKVCKTACLDGRMDLTVLLTVPGIEIRHRNEIFLLKMGLYELTQVPWFWNEIMPLLNFKKIRGHGYLSRRKEGRFKP